MRWRSHLLAGLGLATLVGCAEPERGGLMSVVVSAPAALQCDGRSAFGKTGAHPLTATLRISGNFGPYVFNVENDLSVSGTCDDILAHSPRFLLLTYYVNTDIPLAHLIGFVDLCEETLRQTLPANTDVVDVALQADGVHGVLLHRREDVQALPYEAAEDVSEAPSKGTQCGDGLEEATKWARSVIHQGETVPVEHLDNDTDGISNLQEICDGTY